MAQIIYTYKVEILNLKKKKKYSLLGIWQNEEYNLWFSLHKISLVKMLVTK